MDRKLLCLEAFLCLFLCSYVVLENLHCLLLACVLLYSVIGPINRKDLTKDQAGLGLMGAFPDIEIDTFGYTIDPENPYRCFYFQRWRATHSQDMNVYGTIYPATGMEMETPLSTFSVVWNPGGKIVYERK